MRGDGLSFTVRVARQVHRIRRTRRLPQIINDFAFARNYLQRWLEYFWIVQRHWLPWWLRCGGLRALLTFFLLPFFFFFGQTNPDRLRRQIHYVPNRSLYGVIL